MQDIVCPNMKIFGLAKWQDLAICIYDLIKYSQTLRDDLIVHFMFHEESFLDDDGIRTRRILTNGRKLNRIKLETKFPIVLFSNQDGDGEENDYWFETRPNNSNAKSPYEMFEEFKIENNLEIVDNKIRDYYGLELDKPKKNKQ